jgi:hypothetical protein
VRRLRGVEPLLALLQAIVRFDVRARLPRELTRLVAISGASTFIEVTRPRRSWSPGTASRIAETLVSVSRSTVDVG